MANMNLCCSCRWCETMSLNCGLQRAYCSSRSCYMNMKPQWKETYGKPEELSTTNSTWGDPGANLGFHCDRPANDRVSHERRLFSLSFVWWQYRDTCNGCTVDRMHRRTTAIDLFRSQCVWKVMEVTGEWQFRMTIIVLTRSTFTNERKVPKERILILIMHTVWPSTVMSVEVTQCPG
jgi:hypothetical protein